MVPVERPKTNEKFASREKILKWKTGFTVSSVNKRKRLNLSMHGWEVILPNELTFYFVQVLAV